MNFTSAFATLISNISPKDDYFIKKGYKINEKTIPFLDDTESALSWQIEVYKFAANLAKKEKLSSVFDVGCGHGEKLIKYVYPVSKKIYGMDLKHSIDYCNSNHKIGKWFVDDIEKPSSKLSKKFDLIITSDVIEHLKNPDKLLSYIKNFSHRKTFVVISTPERDLVYGRKSFGPPLNPSHVREWNQKELRNYLVDRGLGVIEQKIVYSSRSGKINGVKVKKSKSCQIVLCQIV